MLGNQPQGLLHARQVLYHWATFLAQAEAVHMCQWTMHQGPASGMGIRERLAVQYLNLHCVCYQLGGRWNEALPKFQTLEHLWRKWSWISGLALAIKTIRQETWFTWVQRYLPVEYLRHLTTVTVPTKAAAVYQLLTWTCLQSWVLSSYKNDF